MRVGIFGGSFDPIHLGHLILAEQCRQQAKLDQVLFIPCALAPHKERGAAGTDRQRVEMIDLAIGGHPDFLRSSIEIERGGVSYTVDTVSQLAVESPDNEWFFLIGADSLNSFASWKSPEAILRLATPLVVGRPGGGEVDLEILAPLTSAQQMEKIRQLRMESPLIEISSSNLRQQIDQGNSIRYQTPRAVEKYIQTQKIYQSKK